MKKTSLLEDVQKCMIDPIYNIIQNFSLEKSKTHYAKWTDQWAAGNYLNNPADKLEQVSFDFANLNDLSLRSIEAQNLYDNMKRQDYIKGCEWEIYGLNVVVSRHRLKTFEEWLHDGLKDALAMAYNSPEDGARKIIEKELGSGIYNNCVIHLFAEGKIDKEILKRLGSYENYQPNEGRDIEKDIEEAKKALEDIEENNKNVIVLKLKM